jgi:NADPH-dependent 2,4-dienoyl-CoA reductase/sulfur reductase-like enzyme
MKVIIVGGVAGGASCAARLRRLDENIEILMVERGPYVSYANCGLPYHVGGAIEKEASLLVATEQTFREQFAIDVRTRCEEPEDFKLALERQPNDIKVVIQFSEL